MKRTTSTPRKNAQQYGVEKAKNEISNQFIWQNNFSTKTLFLLVILLLSTNIVAESEKPTIKGIVTDYTTKQAIAGVLVKINGKPTSTKTNQKGQYQIQATIGEIIVFIHPNYLSEKITIKTVTLNIRLKKKPEKMQNNADSKKQSKTHCTEKSTMLPYAKEVIGIQESVEHTNYQPMLVEDKSYYHRKQPVVYPQNTNTESYASFKENRFIDVKTEALSTFSLDVDAASYSNIRRMINNGQLPEKNSIRVEEMINYFSYNYAQPSGKDPVHINTEIHACPWNKNHLLARIGVKAKEIPTEKLPASNFVFLLDVSGSMNSANKLPLVKSALKLLCNNLRSKDRIAIVVYAGAAGVVLESTPGDDIQKITEAFEKLQAGGSTAGGAGIELAYNIAQKNYTKEGNNRIILCTDGDFNVGISSDKELETLIEQKRKSGVFLTVLGFGMGNYKDDKLQTIAQKGNGNHAYIDNIQEANKVLVNEFGSTMYAVAKDVKLQVEFNPALVNGYRLVGYESRLLNKEDFNDDTKDAAELGAGHTVTALYEIIPAGIENRYGGVDNLRYQTTAKQVATIKDIDFTNEEIMFVKLRYKPIDNNKSIKMEVPVLYTANKRASDDFNFAASVAMFAQILKDSDFKGEATYKTVLDLAEKGIYNDKRGYRSEFIRLVEAVEQMEK